MFFHHTLISTTVTGNHELYLRRGTRAGEEREGGRGKEEEEEEAPAASGSRPGDVSSNPSDPLPSLPRPLRKFRDSVEKLAAINADLAALGVRTTPTLLDGAEVVSFGKGVGGGGGGGGRGGGGRASEGDGNDGGKRKKKKKKTSTPLWIVRFSFPRSFLSICEKERGRRREREKEKEGR